MLLHDVGAIVKFIESELTNKLKESGLTEVKADLLNYKRWFAKSFRCPITSAELEQIAVDLRDKVLDAIEEEDLNNCGIVEFNIKNVEYIQDKDTGNYLMRGTINFQEGEEKVPVSDNKFIIKSCHNLVKSVYFDGSEICNECGNSTKDKKCYDISDCYLKQIANNLLKVVNSHLCDSCDGIGYNEGCLDDCCGTYEAHKCLELLDIEFIEGTE